MNTEEVKRATLIWQKYVDEGERFVNAGQEYSHEEMDKQRNQVIPEVRSLLENYLIGNSPLDEFKTRIDSINKRNRLWGFKGINGQMFFNLLVKTSVNGEKIDEFETILKNTIVLPANIQQAEKALNEFAQFTRDLAKHASDPRGAPKVGSINFFISYFWQIQAPAVYPAYYTSMVDALQEYNLWSPGSNTGQNYTSYYYLNHELLELYCMISGRELTLWDVEHAFWYASIPEQTQQPKPVQTEIPEKGEISQTKTISLTELPDSYIPPVVSILPRLAHNDPELAKICQAMGGAIEKVFENRIDTLFKMLGYETEALGQGHGRVPDGVAICREFHYGIVYDAKVRQQPYTMGTDERAIREYIGRVSDRLRRMGIRQFYFMVISSSFSGDHDDIIRSLKMDTDVREVLLVEASALIALLETKLRNPLLTLGPDGVQRLLANSGILQEADVREFRGL